MKPWAETVDALVRERGQSLFGYAYVLTGDKNRAEDLVQEALVRTFKRGKGDLAIEAAYVYVKKAIFSAFVDKRRRDKARPQTTDNDVEATMRDHADDVVVALSLHQTILTLPPRERACVVLRYLDDLSVKSIAAELEIAPGSVKRYLSGGIAKLRAIHGQMDLGVSDALTGGTSRASVRAKGERA